MAMNIEQLFEGLPIEKQRELRAQIDRFIKLKGTPRKVAEVGDVIRLPKGTLIHGTSVDEEKLASIAESGIITGQAFGIAEDGETFYCADFHRVNHDMSLANYNDQFPYSDGRCPFGRRGKYTLAFILYPDSNLDEIASYDCYREGTKASDTTKDFVNMKGLPVKDTSLAASILFGVPSNFINGIILGDAFINEKTVKFLIDKFPGVFITRNNGEIIYKHGDTLEIVTTRIKSIERQIKLEETERKIEQRDNQIDMQKRDSDKLWSAIATLPVEQIAQVYEQLGWQGDYMEFARRLKEQHTPNNSTSAKL